MKFCRAFQPLVIGLLFCTGCQYHFIPAQGTEQYVLAFNEDGHTVDIHRDFKPDTRGDQTEGRFADLFGAMDCYFRCHPDQPRRILIFAHGGLTTQDADIQRAQWQIPAIKRAGFYPVFIDWNAEFPSSYFEHLAYVRQGEKSKTVDHFLTAPLYLLGDLGCGIARAPSIWTQLSGVDAPLADARLKAMAEHQPHWLVDWTTLNVGKQYLQLADWYSDGAAPLPKDGEVPPISISMGAEMRTPQCWFWDGAEFLGTDPLKYLCVPLLAALGTPAWENMSRRTATLFEDPTEYNVLQQTHMNIDQLLQTGPPGHFEVFLRELETHIADLDKAEPGRAVHVTLVGHSMGTMVLNKALHRHPNLPVDNIVYMAAACSVRDCVANVVPFLVDHPQTQFYDLCLHPTCEIADVELFDLPPRGSLLVWIDEFLNAPQTMADRTFGRWQNVIPHVYLFPQSIWAQFHIKAFDMTPHGETWLDGKPEPQRHGDFSEMPYWDQSFWMPEPPQSPALRSVVDQLRTKLKTVDAHNGKI